MGHDGLCDMKLIDLPDDEPPRGSAEARRDPLLPAAGQAGKQLRRG